MPLLRFGGAQIDVWSANFLFGTELEMKGGWALFGLDLERGAGMVWEQLTCNFSVGSGMYAMLCDGMGGWGGEQALAQRWVLSKALQALAASVGQDWNHVGVYKQHSYGAGNFGRARGLGGPRGDYVETAIQQASSC